MVTHNSKSDLPLKKIKEANSNFQSEMGNTEILLDIRLQEGMFRILWKPFLIFLETLVIHDTVRPNSSINTALGEKPFSFA